MSNEPPSLARVVDLLPKVLSLELCRMLEADATLAGRLEEIRLRRDRPSSLTVGGANVRLPIVLSEADMNGCLAAFSRGALYACAETIAEGYIDLGGGYRVGIAGRAIYEGGAVTGIADVTSFVIRVVRLVAGAGRAAVEAFGSMQGREGILIYAPPGGGKTTMLRDFVATVARTRRVAVIDSRGELSPDFFPHAPFADVLRSYRIADGIVRAVRTLSPEVVVCDEITDADDAEAVSGVRGCGIPIVATAHAATRTELLSRAPIAKLDACGTFGAYIGIRREGENFLPDVTYADEAPA